MKEKIFRFNNGFIGTMNEFCLKFGTSKEKNYRNALKWVGRRYNVMTALEQEAYERKRKYARPDYRVYTGTNCFYSITKSLFEKLDLPVKSDMMYLYYLKKISFFSGIFLMNGQETGIGRMPWRNMPRMLANRHFVCW